MTGSDECRSASTGAAGPRPEPSSGMEGTSATEGASGTGSYYAAIGGAAAVREAVDRFYARVLADEALSGYFTGVDMSRLKRHQALLLAQVLGGPQEYDGRSLAEAHAGLEISDQDYGRVVEHLTGVLRGLGVADDVLVAVADTLLSVQADVATARAGLEEG